MLRNIYVIIPQPSFVLPQAQFVIIKLFTQQKVTFKKRQLINLLIG